MTQRVQRAQRAAGALLSVNGGTAGLFWYDKRQAEAKKWRISERTLCVTALLGGWPAGYWAMRRFRHKCAKKSFQDKYFTATSGNLLFACGLHPRAVFWHLVSTFLGVRRMVFNLSDFSGAEREEVSKILHSQGISVQGGATSPIGGQLQGHPEDRFQALDVSESASSASQIFLALLAMAAGVAIVICYFGQDLEGNFEGAETEERDFGREARAPMFREQSGGEADLELAKAPSPQEPDETQIAADAAE
eukprot:s4167_g10.t3